MKGFHAAALACLALDVGDDDDDDTLKDHEDDEDDRTTTNRLYDHVRDRLSTLSRP